MMKISVRTAVKNDRNFLLQGLREEAAASFVNYRENARSDAALRKVVSRGFLKSGRTIFIAQIGNKAALAVGGIARSRRAGFLFLILKSPKISDERFGHISHIWVDNNFRRAGIAAVLLKRAIGYLKAKNYRKIRALYSFSNLSIKNFCRKNGFKIRRVLVEKRF